MAYTCVRVTFEIGHEASIRAKKTSEGFTHDWELFVRGSDNTEIHHFVEKVIFHLHESFRNPKRVIKEPPYVVKESGYAGFPLPIDIYLKNKHEPSKIRFNYQLTLQDIGPTISIVKREKYVFKNPSEDFRRKLIRGGGVGVGAESASGSHTNHMAALNSDHSADEHRNFVSKNKASPQDGVVAKKSKKENTPKNEEQLSANDPFSIFGQPIKTSKIPLVSKSSSKQQISDKAPPSTEKQAHSSKSSKHSSSSHKDKDKERGGGDKDRTGSGAGGGGEKDKEKTKDKEKDRDKNALKKSIKEEAKKERNKDDKVRIIKTSKDDSKKNSYHEEKTKDKQSEKSLDRSGGEKEVKAEKKDKEKKQKEEKKSKSKDKHKNNEKKENIEVKEYADRTEKIFGKDDFKEEKKYHKIIDDKDDKIEKVGKEKGVEPKSLFSANNANNLDNQAVVNNGDNTRKEEKHKHHKHKKDKSKKDSKRDKEERKEKKESKENKEKPPPPPVEVPRSTPKSDSPKRIKKPLNRLFDELGDKSDSDISSLDDEPITRVVPKEEPNSPDVNIVKQEPITYVKHEEQTKEEKFESGSGKKKKKGTEDRENKKRKRKSKDKEENAANKMIKYENSPEQAVKQNSIEISERASEHRPKSVSPTSETKFTDEYITKLKELQRKIMTLEDNSGLQQIVQVVAETGQYEITTKTFDFDLCTLDESIVQRLLDFFVP